MTRLPSPRLGRVASDMRRTLGARTLADLGLDVDGWEVRLDCEWLDGVLLVLAVRADPAVKPECDYLMMVWQLCPTCGGERETCDACDDTGGRRALASVSLAGELVPVTTDRRGKPVHRFPRRVWQRARHAIEQAREVSHAHPR